MSTQQTYKPGDVYDDWKELQRLTENDTVNKGALIVRVCDINERLKEGTVCVASETSEKNNRYVFVGDSGWDKWRFALLPADSVAKNKTDEKFRRVWTQHQTVTQGVVTIERIKSNDGIDIEGKDAIQILVENSLPGCKEKYFSLAAAKETHAKLTAALKQHKAAFGA